MRKIFQKCIAYFWFNEVDNTVQKNVICFNKNLITLLPTQLDHLFRRKNVQEEYFNTNNKLIV